MRRTATKPFLSFVNRPLLQSTLDLAHSLKPGGVVLVSHPDFEAEMRSVMALPPGARIVCQHERTGTLDAARLALDVVTTPRVLILFCDSPLVSQRSLRALEEAHVDGGAVLATVCVPNPFGLGRIVKDASGQVQAIIEEYEATDEQKAIKEIFPGVMLADCGLLRTLIPKVKPLSTGEYGLPSVVQLASDHGLPVTTLMHTEDESDEWRTCNTLAEMSQLAAIVRRERVEQLMAQGVLIAQPDRVDIRGAVVAGDGCVIEGSAVFEGYVRLGDNVTVGNGARIDHSVIGDGVNTGTWADIERSIIRDGASFRDKIRLRPGSVIQERATFRTLAEVKNSTVGPDFQANDGLTLPDGWTGQRVAIGRGTTMANYDGTQKQRVVIRDDVIVGSISVLIAPRHIGRGARIGERVALRVPVPDHHRYTQNQQLVKCPRGDSDDV